MPLDQLQQNDLSLSMPLDGIGLIEASAGTGKTFTIAGLYARMVVEQKHPVREILVMTFTRAAAEELRSRLRERLELCRDLLADPAGQPGGPEPDTDKPEALRVLALLRRVRRAGDEDEKALRRRIREAVQRMDEALVTTIHGFCQRVLTEYAVWVDAGGPDLVLEPSDDDLLEDIAADLWLEVAGDDDGARLSALAMLAGDAQALAKQLKDLVGLDGRLEPAPVEPVPEAVDTHAAWQALVAAWQAHGAAAAEQFETWFAAGHLKANIYKEDKARDQLARLRHELAHDGRPDDKDLARFSLAKLQAAVKKNAPAFPEQAAFAAIDAWREAEAAVQARIHAQATHLLHELAREAGQRLARRKRELQRHAYDDLVLRLHEAVTGASAEPPSSPDSPLQANSATLVQHLRRQFPRAMVDEFQDTSARQWQILQALYGEPGGLLMIGDPKQAIYRFRGGDVHTYLAAARRADHKESLHENFRSTPAMLAAAKALFTRNPDVFMEEDIRFTDVAAGADHGPGLLRAGEPVRSLTLWPLPDAGNAEAQRDALARAAACQVAGLLDSSRWQLDAGQAPQAVKPEKLAVLVNSNAESLLVLEALRAVGVPAVSVQKKSVYESHEAYELLRLLDGLLAPGSQRAVRSALATDLLGWSLADLDAEDARSRRQQEHIVALRDTWQARGVLAMLETAIEQAAERLLALADGERRLSNLMQLGELAQQAAHQRAGGPALRDWLARRIRDADSKREDEQLRLESDAECVRVMTLHASKGLEFDLVLIPFMAVGQGKSPGKGDLLQFHDDDGYAVKRLLMVDKEGRTGGDREALDRSGDEALAEKVRLLYVGVTRARYACWLGVAGAGKHRKVLDQVLPGAADGRCLADAQPEHVAVQAPPEAALGSPDAPAARQLGNARHFEARVRRDWWVHSFSQLNRGHRELVLDEPADRDEQAAPAAARADGEPEIIAWPRGPGYGNAVHAVLEHADFAIWRDAAEAPQKGLQTIRTYMRQAGFAGTELERATAATGELLCASLNTPCIDGMRLVDIADADRCAEMRFHFGIKGVAGGELLAALHAAGYQRSRRRFANLHGQLRGLMHGIIDLVCRVDGRWWVIDYKTNHVGDHGADYDQPGLQAEVERAGYDLQYLIYTVATHRWLKQVLGRRYNYADHFGGVRYLFLRGMHPQRGRLGIHANKPSADLVEQLDRLLAAPREDAA